MKSIASWIFGGIGVFLLGFFAQALVLSGEIKQTVRTNYSDVKELEHKKLNKTVFEDYKADTKDILDEIKLSLGRIEDKLSLK